MLLQRLGLGLDTNGLINITAWHLPGWPVGPPAKWAAMSNVEVVLTTYPINMEGQTDKVTKRRRGKEGVERGRGLYAPLAREEGLYLDICAESLPVSSYAYLARAGSKAGSKSPGVSPNGQEVVGTPATH